MQAYLDRLAELHSDTASDAATVDMDALTHLINFNVRCFLEWSDVNGPLFNRSWLSLQDDGAQFQMHSDAHCSVTLTSAHNFGLPRSLYRPHRPMEAGIQCSVCGARWEA